MVQGEAKYVRRIGRNGSNESEKGRDVIFLKERRTETRTDTRTETKTETGDETTEMI